MIQYNTIKYNTIQYNTIPSLVTMAGMMYGRLGSIAATCVTNLEHVSNQDY